MSEPELFHPKYQNIFGLRLRQNTPIVRLDSMAELALAEVEAKQTEHASKLTQPKQKVIPRSFTRKVQDHLRVRPPSYQRLVGNIFVDTSWILRDVKEVMVGVGVLGVAALEKLEAQTTQDVDKAQALGISAGLRVEDVLYNFDVALVRGPQGLDAKERKDAVLLNAAVKLFDDVVTLEGKLFAFFLKANPWYQAIMVACASLGLTFTDQRLEVFWKYLKKLETLEFRSRDYARMLGLIPTLMGANALGWLNGIPQASEVMDYLHQTLVNDTFDGPIVGAAKAAFEATPWAVQAISDVIQQIITLVNNKPF